MTPGSRTPIDWSNEATLERLRQTGDRLADDVIEGFIGGDGAMGRREVVRRTVAGVAGEPYCAEEAFIHDYLLEAPPLPPWADPRRLVDGQRFFREHRGVLNLAFLLGSLPMSYAGRDGALVLHRTGMLRTETKRRVFETALLVMDLAEPGPIDPTHPGYLMVRRLRLLHAAVRRAVADDELTEDGVVVPDPWDTTANGCPVSQLDLLGTLWTFSLTSLDVLDKCGVRVTRRERAGWIHLWNVVGELLGVGYGESHPLLPMEEREARRCFVAIQRKQFQGEEEEGRDLTADLLEMVRGLMPDEAMDWLVDDAVRHFVGPRLADRLAVPPATVTGLFRPVRLFWSRTQAWGWAIRPVARRLLDQFYATMLRTLEDWVEAQRQAGRSLRAHGDDDVLVQHLHRLAAEAEATATAAQAGRSAGWGRRRR